MKRFRRRSLRARIAIFAVLALLWSQAVLAGHPACSMGFMALSELEAKATLVVEGGTHGCHEAPAPSDDALCATHCGQGSLSSEVTRVPDVPALPAANPVGMAEVVFLSADPRRQHHALPPPVCWHRPTPHPAALFLF